MPMIRSGDARAGDTAIPQPVLDLAEKVFRVAVVVTLLAIVYLIYGLFSGALADVASHSHAEKVQAMQTLGMVSNILNISLVATLVSATLLYYEEASAAVVMLFTSAFLAYGLQYLAEFLGLGGKNFQPHGATVAALKELQLAAVMTAVPGVLIMLRSIGVRLLGARDEDIANSAYGKNAQAQGDQPTALLGVAAKCWQLPYCREGIRKTCPIFHARTKCWKQRVGCMCEENIIRLAQAPVNGDAPATIEMAKGMGFVAIGDLIAKSEAEVRPNIPTKAGPRGVRIPTNPHLSEGQKRERCRNCIIYNEHQRQKYRFFAPVVTLAVPALVYFEFENLQNLLQQVLKTMDQVFGRLTFNAEASSKLSQQVTGSLSIEIILIGCLTLVGMTWALRFLEYCTFKIKI